MAFEEIGGGELDGEFEGDGFVGAGVFAEVGEDDVAGEESVAGGVAGADGFSFGGAGAEGEFFFLVEDFSECEFAAPGGR